MASSVHFAIAVILLKSPAKLAIAELKSEPATSITSTNGAGPLSLGALDINAHIIFGIINPTGKSSSGSSVSTGSSGSTESTGSSGSTGSTGSSGSTGST